MSEEKNKNHSRRAKASSASETVASTGLRLNLLFAVIFMLFMVLLGRLYYMQVLHKGFYEKKLQTATVGVTGNITEAMPRGQIFDAKGKVIAATNEDPAITFTRSTSITSDEMRKNAQRLVPILSNLIDDSGLTKRDLKDYYLSNPANLKKVTKLLSDKEKYDSNGHDLPSSQVYASMISKVKDSDVNYQGNDLLAAALYKAMNGTKNFATTSIIFGDITPEQQAEVASQQSKLYGISFGSYWKHSIDQNNVLAPLIGSVSTEKAGLPKGKEDYYLKRGYAPNDRVGTSYLEEGYESYLQGKHKVLRVDANANGTGKKVTVLNSGKQGNNLKLTIDSQFENGVQKILSDQFNNMLSQGYGAAASGAYVTVLNPQTGAIIAMNGLSRDVKTGEIIPNSLGNMIDSFTPGSVVKPGTLTAGWQTGVINGNQVINTQPIKFAGSNPIQDWLTSGFGPIPADVALEYSSNTYMTQVALKIFGQEYSPGMTLNGSNKNQVYAALRKAYGQYGLGVATGIDIPGESTGLVPASSSTNATAANAIFESFGQFDNYTPLQLAQYAATIANNGTRVAPHIVEGIYESNNDSLGKEVKKIQTKTMNKVDISKANMDIIKQGMYEVVHGDPNMATGTHVNDQTKISVSAKTGTSESLAPDASGQIIVTTVNNIIAYAPSDNPKIAIGIMIPDTTGTVENESHINQDLTAAIVNLYNKMYGMK